MKYKYSTSIYLYVSLLGVMFFATSCTSTHKVVSLESNTGLVWPSKPASPRIAYVASFHHPDDFGISRGFFTWLGELFTGEKERKMVRPMAITQTSDNILFVADPGVKGVHRFDLKNKKYSLIRLADNKLLPSPVGLAADKSGNVYVVDSELGQLFKIKKNSDEAIAVTLQSSLLQPTSIAISSDNNSFYITDTASHHVKKFSFNGKLISVIGKRGKAKGEFNYPTMIWLDKSDQLFVTDSLNFRVQVFNNKGKFVRYFGKQGTGTGHLSRPKGVATDANGHVYVIDGLFHVFQLFDTRGRFLLHIGGQGQSPGEFWLPSGIFINKKNVIYIADSHNQRVQVFRYIGEQS